MNIWKKPIFLILEVSLVKLTFGNRYNSPSGVSSPGRAQESLYFALTGMREFCTCIYLASKEVDRRLPRPFPPHCYGNFHRESWNIQSQKGPTRISVSRPLSKWGLNSWPWCYQHHAPTAFSQDSPWTKEGWQLLSSHIHSSGTRCTGCPSWCCGLTWGPGNLAGNLPTIMLTQWQHKTWKT